MNIKKLGIVLTALLLMTVSIVGCGSENTTNQTEEKEFQYYTAEQLKKSVENEEDIVLLDIQVEEEWDKHHIKGAIETNAYPVKSDEDKMKLEPVLPTLEENENPVVIICPGGAGGAERTHAYLVEKGIDENRLFILENGQSKWPYEELLEK